MIRQKPVEPRKEWGFALTGNASGPSPWSLAAIGAIAGLAWAAALRSYMWQIATDNEVTWLGTFIAILLPGSVAGALLGWAEARRRAGAVRRLRWFALAPFAFAVATFSLPGQLTALFTTGLGGGALGLPALVVLGGFALGKVGHPGVRIASGAVAVAGMAGIVSTVPIVGGEHLALGTPRGLWAAILVATLMIVGAIAATIPFRLAPANER